MELLAASVLLSFSVACIATVIVRRVAIRFGILSQTNNRSVHQSPRPLMGGVAIFAAFLACLALIVSFSGSQLNTLIRELAVFLTGGFIVLILGVYDDIKGATWYQKFLFEFIAAGIVVAFGYKIAALNFLFGKSIFLSWLGVPFTLLWIVAVTNAVNLIDGLDGMASGISLFAAAFIVFISLWFGNIASAFPAAILAGALIAFLIFNFNPAKIFLGDSGSLFLGFMLACFSINGTFRDHQGVALFVPAIVLGIPIVDMILAFFRRLLRRKNPFVADREHIHHRLLYLGFSHRSASLTIVFVSFLWGLMAAVMYIFPGVLSYSLLLLIGGILIYGLVKLKFVGKKV